MIRFGPPFHYRFPYDRWEPETFAVQSVTIEFNDIRIKRNDAALRRAMRDYAFDRVTDAMRKVRRHG